MLSLRTNQLSAVANLDLLHSAANGSRGDPAAWLSASVVCCDLRNNRLEAADACLAELSALESLDHVQRVPHGFLELKQSGLNL